jgi:hypothetical protein
MTLTIP